MDVETAINEVFVDEGYKSEKISLDDNMAKYIVENEDVTCDIELEYTKGTTGVYTDVSLKFTSYFGELYKFEGGVYESDNEIRRQ